MDKVKAGIFQNDVNEALKAVLEKHGLELDGSRLTYGDVQSSITIKVVPKGVNLQEEAFKKHAHLYGLHPDDLGKEISMNGGEFIIVGLKANARKNTVIIQRKGSRSQYVIPHQRVVRLLAASAASAE